MITYTTIYDKTTAYNQLYILKIILMCCTLVLNDIAEGCTYIPESNHLLVAKEHIKILVLLPKWLCTNYIEKVPCELYMVSLSQ